MTSPLGVGRLLGKIVEEIGVLVRQLGEADWEASKAKAEYDRAYAVAYRQASGSVESRRHTATEVTHGRRLEAEEAASKVRSIKAEIRWMETRVDVGRSYGAALRAEAAAVNTPWTEG